MEKIDALINLAKEVLCSAYATKCLLDPRADFSFTSLGPQPCCGHSGLRREPRPKEDQLGDMLSVISDQVNDILEKEARNQIHTVRDADNKVRALVLAENKVKAAQEAGDV